MKEYAHNKIEKSFTKTKDFPWRVDLYESEREWGSKIDDSYYFRTQENARLFIKLYNEEFNSSDEVPDWYISAVEGW